MMNACRAGDLANDERATWEPQANGQLKLVGMGNNCLELVGESAPHDVARTAVVAATSAEDGHGASKAVDDDEVRAWRFALAYMEFMCVVCGKKLGSCASTV